MLGADRRIAQVVVAEFARQTRLVVPDEIRSRLADVGPLGETFAPPCVVFGDAVELRKVERDDPDWRSASIGSRYADTSRANRRPEGQPIELGLYLTSSNRCANQLAIEQRRRLVRQDGQCIVDIRGGAFKVTVLEARHAEHVPARRNCVAPPRPPIRIAQSRRRAGLPAAPRVPVRSLLRNPLPGESPAAGGDRAP